MRIGDLKPHNDKGQRHGYWKRHFADGSLFYERTYINGVVVGYYEWNVINRDFKIKTFYII